MVHRDKSSVRCFTLGITICLTPIIVLGCAAREQRFAARRLPAELLAQPWQAPCRSYLSQAVAVEKSATIQPGDELEITLSNAERPAEFNQCLALVREDGTAALPSVGNVVLAGMTPARATQVVSQICYDQGFSPRPAVHISHHKLRSNSVTISGAVEKPGVYVLPRDRCQLAHVIAAAGGLSRDANGRITIQPLHQSANGVQDLAVKSVAYEESKTMAFPEGQRREINLNALPAEKLVDGDLIVIEKGSIPKVLVTGQVHQPGEYEFPIDREFRVLDAIARAHGIPNKVIDTVVVCRRLPNQTERSLISVSLHAATRDEVDNLLLMPDDIISVEPDSRTLVKDSFKYVGFAAAGGLMLLRGKP